MVDVPIFGIIEGVISNTHYIAIVNNLLSPEIFLDIQRKALQAWTMPSHCNWTVFDLSTLYSLW